MKYLIFSLIYINKIVIFLQFFEIRLKKSEEDALELIERAIAIEDADLLDELMATYKTPKICNEALFYAVRRSAEDMVKIILRQGGDVNGNREYKLGRGFKGRQNVLSCAVASGNAEMVRFLIENGADVRANNVLAVKGNRYEKCVTELGLAAWTGNAKIVEILLEHGANFEEGQVYPLSYAAGNDKLEVVELLLSRGANIEGLDRVLEFSPIIHAASHGHERMVDYLLDQGAKRCGSALVYAVANNHLKVVKLLLDRGFDVNTRFSLFGPSLSEATIHAAVHYSKDTKILQLLLDHGARIINDNDNESYLNWTGFIPRNKNVKQMFRDLEGQINVNIYPEMLNHGLYIFDLDERYYDMLKMLVRHVILIKSQNFHVSETIWNSINIKRENQHFIKKCQMEIERLKAEQFDESTWTWYDILLTKDLHKLTALTSNESIVKILRSIKGFKSNFPMYGDLIVCNVKKGYSKRRDFEFVKWFFNHLFSREVNNKLPNLPFICLCKIFTFLSDSDICNLRRIF